MADFWTVSLQTTLDQSAIAAALSQAMPELVWKTGESDAQGPYVTGRLRGHAEIKLWLDEGIVDATIYAPMPPEGADPASWARDLARRVIEEILPRIGHVTSVREGEG